MMKIKSFLVVMVLSLVSLVAYADDNDVAIFQSDNTSTSPDSTRLSNLQACSIIDGKNDKVIDAKLDDAFKIVLKNGLALIRGGASNQPDHNMHGLACMKNPQDGVMNVGYWFYSSSLRGIVLMSIPDVEDGRVYLFSVELSDYRNNTAVMLNNKYLAQ